MELRKLNISLFAKVSREMAKFGNRTCIISIKVVRGTSVRVYHTGDLLSMPAYADIREMPARDFLRASERASERSCESGAELIDSSH